MSLNVGQKYVVQVDEDDEWRVMTAYTESLFYDNEADCYHLAEKVGYRVEQTLKNEGGVKIDGTSELSDSVIVPRHFFESLMKLARERCL